MDACQTFFSQRNILPFMFATVRPDLPYYIYSMVNTETLILKV